MTTPVQKLLGGLVLGGAAAWYLRRNKVETVTKDGKTYQVRTASADKANQIARENFDRRVQQLTDRLKK